MSSREKYKQAYGQWRLLSKQRDGMNEKARAALYGVQADLIDNTYGDRIGRSARVSYLYRNQPVYEGSYVHRVDRKMGWNSKPCTGLLKTTYKGVMLSKA